MMQFENDNFGEEGLPFDFKIEAFGHVLFFFSFYSCSPNGFAMFSFFFSVAHQLSERSLGTRET